MLLITNPAYMVLSFVFIPFLSMIVLMLFYVIKDAPLEVITDEELWASVRVSSPEAVRRDDE